MILRDFIPYTTYNAGDYVLDPDTNVIFQVIVSPTEPDADGEVTVGVQAPAFDAEHFTIAKDLPTK